MNILDVLKAARAKLAKRGGWIQGISAADKEGDMVGYNHEAAVSFCMWGAINSVTSSGRLVIGASKALRAAMPYPESITGYNDAEGRKKRQILALFDKAIAKLESK